MEQGDTGAGHAPRQCGGGFGSGGHTADDYEVGFVRERLHELSSELTASFTRIPSKLRLNVKAGVTQNSPLMPQVAADSGNHTPLRKSRRIRVTPARQTHSDASVRHPVEPSP
jgi:hypothetical protein